MPPCGSPGKPSGQPGGPVTRSAWPSPCSSTPGPPPLPKRSPGSWIPRQSKRHSSASTDSGTGGSPRSFSGGGPRPAAAIRAAASSGSGPHWPRWTPREPQGTARSRSGCWPRPSCWPAVLPKPATRCAWPPRRRTGWACTSTTRSCAPCKPGSSKQVPGAPARAGRTEAAGGLMPAPGLADMTASLASPVTPASAGAAAGGRPTARRRPRPQHVGHLPGRPRPSATPQASHAGAAQRRCHSLAQAAGWH